MPMPSSAVHDHIVREPAPAELEPNETPIAIACEPPGVPDGAGARGTMFIRLKAGTTPEEARAITSMLQARVKGLFQLEASSDEAA